MSSKIKQYYFATILTVEFIGLLLSNGGEKIIQVVAK
jgi:hypothetical protein